MFIARQIDMVVFGDLQLRVMFDLKNRIEILVLYYNTVQNYCINIIDESAGIIIFAAYFLLFSYYFSLFWVYQFVLSKLIKIRSICLFQAYRFFPD